MNRHSYVGVVLPRATRDDIARLQQRLGKWARAHSVSMRSIPRRLLALPLDDLGDVSAVTLEAAEVVIERVAAQMGPLTVMGERVGAFPDVSSPRSLHLALADPEGQLAALRAALREGLEGYGFALDARAFAPHIPLGLVDEGAPPLPHLRLDETPVPVRTLGVFTRVPTADGRMAWTTRTTRPLAPDGAPPLGAESAGADHRDALRRLLDERLSARKTQARARPPRRRRPRPRTSNEKEEQ